VALSAARDERGLSESVQLAVVWPVLMLVTLGVIESGIWLHARNVAERAAVAAVGAASGSYGDDDAARELGRDLAASGGLSNVEVAVSRAPDTVSVVVSADSPLVLDLGLGRIRETAAGPRERVTAP
jgi:Flp pilus assembly protein TadG